MRYLIWFIVFVVGAFIGLVFGWNSGRQNLIDELTSSRERLRRHQNALAYEEIDEE